MAEPHPQVVDPQHPLVAWVREVCMGYPEAAEVEAWGRPTFRAGKKIFVLVGASMDDALTIVFKPGSADERLAYLERPSFYSPPYWGPGGWLAVPLGGQVSTNELAEIIDTSYRQVALVRQVKALDAATDQ
jgi:predicted DNA-binding protein (MmcQ/YjbR family)